jgi:hypothetical protein
MYSECYRVRKSINRRSHDAVIRVYDDAGDVIETHEHQGEFKEWRGLAISVSARSREQAAAKRFRAF